MRRRSTRSPCWSRSSARRSTPVACPPSGPGSPIGEFGFDPRAIGTGISTVLTANPPTRRQALTVPLALRRRRRAARCPKRARPRRGARRAGGDDLRAEPARHRATEPPPRWRTGRWLVTLDGGSDGGRPDFDRLRAATLGFNDLANAGNPAALTMQRAAGPGADRGHLHRGRARGLHRLGGRRRPTVGAEQPRQINNAVIAPLRADALPGGGARHARRSCCPTDGAGLPQPPLLHPRRALLPVGHRRRIRSTAGGSMCRPPRT